MKNKTVLIGLDGATWKNLMIWIKEGKLPFFKKIIETGVHGINKTTIPCLTSPAIPSFYTGLHPTKTKTFGFRKNTGEIISSRDIHGDRFWDILGNNNFKSFISGLRTTYPPKIKEGTLISSILVPSEESEFVYPKSEKKYFLGYFGRVLTNSEKSQMQKKDRRKLLEIALDNYNNRFNIMIKYLKKNKFDFILIYFGVTDYIQHNLWNSQELILECYKEVERKVKEISKIFNGWNFMFFSDHGFGKSPDSVFYINKWLYDKQYLFYRNLFSKNLENLFKRVYYFIGWKMEKYLPKKLYRNIYKIAKSNKKRKVAISIDPSETNKKFIDLNKTRAYLDQKWGIKIIKENVENYEKFREELIKKLKNIKDRNNNEIFKEIYKKENLYKDAHKFNSIPDIIFTLNQKYEIRSGYNKRIVSKIKSKRRVEGSHEYQRDAIFMAYGPDIKENLKLKKSINICDISTTILYMYDVAIPKEIDGVVLKEIFKDSSDISKRHIKYIKSNKTKKVVDNIDL